MESGKPFLQDGSRIFEFHDVSFHTLLAPTPMELVHVVLKFPEAEIEGIQLDTVSLEIAHLSFKIQQTKVEINKDVLGKTKEQLDYYNKCVEQLDKARKDYHAKELL